MATIKTKPPTLNPEAPLVERSLVKVVKRVPKIFSAVIVILKDSAVVETGNVKIVEPE